MAVHNVGPKPTPFRTLTMCILRGGEIVAVGFLDGVTAEWNPGELMLSLWLKRGTSS